MDDGAYEVITGDILVRVRPRFLPEQSDQSSGRFVWSYTVEIENRGRRTVQLLARHWIITDAANRTEEVKGPGVVGEQPVLRPGEAFRYVSGCPLTTSSGSMRGAYQMRAGDGEAFDIAIPEFSLHAPRGAQRLN